MGVRNTSGSIRPAHRGGFGRTSETKKKHAPPDYLAKLPDKLEAGPATPPKSIDPRQPVASDEVMVGVYNVENLFDTKPLPGNEYDQFTPNGDYAWTEAKLAQKLKNVGKVIRQLNGGKGPGDGLSLPLNYPGPP